MSELNIVERNRKVEHFTDKIKKRRYTKSKLLELRRNKKCQEWPRIFSKKFIGIDGKWDPVGAFENNNFFQRTHSRDDIQHLYNERYRKRQRDDYKYYWYGESTKRYSSSYGANYSHYYSSNSKQRYQYENDMIYESSQNRGLSDDYYATYSYQSGKYRNSNEKDKDTKEIVSSDHKPEWFTGGPSNINETIELSGMSRELEAGILKNRKSNKRNDEGYVKSKKTNSESDSNSHFSVLNNDNTSQIDSHLLKIIQNNAKENDKRKISTSAKEVEKVLKSILLRPNEECQETSTLSQNSNGVVLTVNEIEANLKLKGNSGAGDMSAYYKLLGLVQNNFNVNLQEDNKVVNSASNKSLNHTITSTNNNHPRQFTNSKYPTTLKNERNILKLNNEYEMDNLEKVDDSAFVEAVEKEPRDKMIKQDFKCELEKISTRTTNNSLKYDETANSEGKKVNGINNYNVHNVNNTLRNERLAMASRNVCNPLSSQFSNHMIGTGQNAYRWIRAMYNAASASARITQINQAEYGSIPETFNNEKIENKVDAADIPLNNNDCNSLDAFNRNLDNNFRINSDQPAVSNQFGSYINNCNLSNYMVPGSPLYNQLTMKQFLPFGYSQSSMFGRQFLNPYLLQQLFMHKQWENRNISLQNQLRQFQSMIFNCNTQASSVNNTVTNNTNNPTFVGSTTVSLNQGDCSAISASK